MRLRAEQSRYNVSALAKSCGCSPRELQRFFVAHSSMTPKQWLQRLRLLRAFELLRKGLSLKEVAFTCGYLTPAHFTTDFTAATGMTPTEFASANSVMEMSLAA
jgi:AraC-like DNA-binding protein